MLYLSYLRPLPGEQRTVDHCENRVGCSCHTGLCTVISRELYDTGQSAVRKHILLVLQSIANVTNTWNETYFLGFQGLCKYIKLNDFVYYVSKSKTQMLFYMFDEHVIHKVLEHGALQVLHTYISNNFIIVALSKIKK